MRLIETESCGLRCATPWRECSSHSVIQLDLAPSDGPLRGSRVCAILEALSSWFQARNWQVSLGWLDAGMEVEEHRGIMWLYTYIRVPNQTLK